jgi:hypothetical protein
MRTTTFSQPESQLGVEFTKILSGHSFKRIIFVSAFTALKAILRIRESILRILESGTAVRLVLGIDLGGTSREVLEELLNWNCEVFLYHNPISRSTFHPKIYLFESINMGILFIGSNNLTDGGLYTNYEACSRYDFIFPHDAECYRTILTPIISFLEPEGPTVQRLNAAIIETLSIRGLLNTEDEARISLRNRNTKPRVENTQLPENPFTPSLMPYPPLLKISIRKHSLANVHIAEPNEESSSNKLLVRPQGILVWKKKLPRTDALNVNEGSHHVGGVRLTQARFEIPQGQRIDQTTYFRTLFDDYDWETEPGGYSNQEHTFIPMRIFIRGTDLGIHNFEISHKPSGESGQDNYTTILRWGRNFTPTIRNANLTGCIFNLYEISNLETEFLIDITDQ